MGLLDKAKGLSDRVVEKAVEFSSDELIADTIIKAVEKQEKVNRVLEARGSKYRVSNINMQMGIPPNVEFGIQRITEESSEK